MHAARSPLLVRIAAAVLLLAAVTGLAYTALASRYPDLNCRQNQIDLYLPLHSGSPLTQTIQPAADGFASLTLYVQTIPGVTPTTSHFTLRVEEDRLPPLLITEIQRPLSSVRNGKAEFYFPAQPESAGKTYRLLLSTDAPPGLLSLAASYTNRYPAGALYAAENPPGAQDLAFSTYRRPSPLSWLALARRAAPSFGRGLGLTLLFTLAGLLVCFILPSPPPSGPLSSFLLYTLGLGISLLILIGYAQSIFGIPISLGSLLAWSGVLLSAALLRGRANRQILAPLFRRPAATGEDAAVLGLLLFSLASRALQTVDLEALPLWVDGLNHYAILSSLAGDQTLSLHINYPYGYHLLSYTLHLLSSLNLPAAAFHTGFWVSALAAPAAYPLARRLLHRPTLALLSVILYGFLAPFPAYLAAWSRFPFLLGLTLLPLALFAALDWLETSPRPLRHEVWRVLPPALLAAALFLSHFGTLVHWAAFLLAALLVWPFHKKEKALLKLRLLRLTGLALPAALIVLVKIASLVQKGGWHTALWANRSANLTVDLRHIFHLTTQTGGWLLWGLATAGVLAALPRKTARRLTGLTLLWLFILAIMDLLQLLLLGTAISSLTNYLIALSLPFSWLGASALGAAFHVLQPFLPSRPMPAWLPGIALVLLLLVGSIHISGILNPATILFTAEDQQALGWIRQETPPDAIFLIDTFQWGANLTPSNGGGWIPALTQRAVLYPPRMLSPDELQIFLSDHPATHIYTVPGLPLPEIPLLANLHLVYHNSRVAIYALPEVGDPIQTH